MTSGKAYRVRLSNESGPANLFELLAAWQKSLSEVKAESPDPYEVHAAEQALREVERLRVLVPDFINGTGVKPEPWHSLVYEAAASGISLGGFVAQINASSSFGDIVQAKLRSAHAIQSANARKRITDDERTSVGKMANDLAGNHPVPAELYRAIAEELKMKLDRVRYILKGPRRGKR